MARQGFPIVSGPGHLGFNCFGAEFRAFPGLEKKSPKNRGACLEPQNSASYLLGGLWHSSPESARRLLIPMSFVQVRGDILHVIQAFT